MIQWFPGHMAKARRQMEKCLAGIDLIWEVADARLPRASRNPLLAEFFQRRHSLLILTKKDLADPAVTARWLASSSPSMLAVNLHEKRDMVGKLMRSSQQLLAGKRLRKELRVMIIGIPNVGKSSLINCLAPRASSATGKLPGVTRAQQWIRINPQLILLDTPGVLWPSFEKPAVGKALAATGAIRDAIFAGEQVGTFLLRFLQTYYPTPLAARYPGLSAFPQIDWLSHIGRRRGCLQSGGSVDIERAAAAVLRDFRSGRLGRVTLEQPGAAYGAG